MFSIIVAVLFAIIDMNIIFRPKR